MLDQFRTVIEQFFGGEISLEEFETRFVTLWRAALDDFLLEPTPEAGIIGDLFLEVDTFSNYRKEFGSAPCDVTDQLCEAAATALRKLSALPSALEKDSPA